MKAKEYPNAPRVGFYLPRGTHYRLKQVSERANRPMTKQILFWVEEAEENYKRKK